MKRQVVTIMSVFLMLTYSGCRVGPEVNPPEFYQGEVEGYRPVYGTEEDLAIEVRAARPLENPGKICLAGRYLFINEKSQGIHVFDNIDPTHPVAIRFLYVPGNTEIAFKNDVLYIDHLTNLVALNVSDWSNVRELSRSLHAKWSRDLPPLENKYFECADPSKGTVVHWELALLKNPKCFR